MLAFAIRMIITDIQKTYCGFCIILYLLFLGMITVIPFIETDFYHFYMIAVVVSGLQPHITKVFYVLPLSNNLIRRYLHLRTIVISTFFIVVGCIITLISQKWKIPNIEKGWLMILFCVMLSILISLTAIRVTMIKNKEKHTIVITLVFILLTVGLINTVVLFNFKLQLFFNFFSIMICISSELII